MSTISNLSSDSNAPRTAAPIDGDCAAELNAWIDSRPLTDEDVDNMYIEEMSQRDREIAAQMQDARALVGLRRIA